MRKATVGQVLHINKMFLEGGLSRACFDEVNRMAGRGELTFETAKAITEGTFAFQNALTDVHLAKVRRVWETFGKQVFGVPFEKYLNGTDNLEAVPMLSEWPDLWSASFNRDNLVDGRVVTKIGLIETCKLAGLIYRGEDDTLVPYDPKVALSGVRWMRCQAGHKNRNRRPFYCRKSFAAFEIGMDAIEGVFTYVDDKKVIDGHYMDLPGSVLRDNRDYYAYLGGFDGGPELGWCWFDDANPNCGSASRGNAPRPSAT